MIDGVLLVVIGTSAGGVEALRALVRELPSDVRAALLVVLHLPSDADTLLAGILARAGDLPCTTATDGAAVVPGTILVSPPNHHLVARGTTVGLDDSPPSHGHRPAIDNLFTSAADTWGAHALGVVLSGMLDDGAEGLLRLREAGAVTVVQEPGEAAFANLPHAAIRRGGAQHILPVADIAALIVSRAAELQDAPSIDQVRKSDGQLG